MLNRLIWIVRRLQAMGLPEIAYRVQQLVYGRLQKLGLGLARPGFARSETSQPWCTEMPTGLDVACYAQAADQVLAGRLDIFAMRGATLGFPPNWNRDPKTQTIAPMEFGKTLNYRDEKLVGDIKYLWEPNRHLQLVTLAQAWRLTGQAQYAQGCQTLLDSWFAQCPYPLGVHWTSSLEHSVRLMNWAFAWHLLGGNACALFEGKDGAAFKARWLVSIYQHCHFIAGHFSRYSSANNHLLGEYMGLLIGSTIWPLWRESARWQSVAKQGFEREALLQNGSDGVNKEQAVYYHHEVADMMVLGGLICKANGIEFGAEYWARLESMLEFLAALMDKNGHVPMIGDSDDALMVRLSQEPGWCPYQSLLATGAILFKRGDFAAKAGRLDDKSRWLLGDSAAHALAALEQPLAETPKTAFPEGGYYVLGARYGTADEVRAVVDCGPLGYLSIAAHGHADALSMVLSAGGRELLVDPGTYAYHTQKKWRDYFRSTFAHNTVCVDGVDQSVIGGNFLWLDKANAQCHRFDVEAGLQRFTGGHDGYQRLSDPVTHQREIIFDPAHNAFQVQDSVSCKGDHALEICWHFAEDCVVTLKDGQVVAESGSVQLRMAMDVSQMCAEILRGQDEPAAAWVSRSFDVKVPTTTVVWRGRINGNTQLATRINLFFALEG